MALTLTVRETQVWDNVCAQSSLNIGPFLFNRQVKEMCTNWLHPAIFFNEKGAGVPDPLIHLEFSTCQTRESGWASVSLSDQWVYNHKLEKGPGKFPAMNLSWTDWISRRCFYLVGFSCWSSCLYNVVSPSHTEQAHLENHCKWIIRVLGSITRFPSLWPANLKGWTTSMPFAGLGSSAFLCSTWDWAQSREEDWFFFHVNGSF